MLRNLLRGNSQISSKDDLLNSLYELSERSKATKLCNDTLIKGLFTMTAFGREANEQDFQLQLAAVKAVLVTATLFGRGWMTELPSTCFAPCSSITWKKKKKKKMLFKVEQNCKYNTSEFAITSTSHTIIMYNKIYNIYNKIYK